MFDKKVTRGEFLRMAGFAMIAAFVIPLIKRAIFFKSSGHKEARYYKKLAG
ncbi:MAG: hypothetical protein WC569_04095 [Candidatus Omnitrophota bacterium]